MRTAQIGPDLRLEHDMVARHDIRAVMARTPTPNRINHAGLVKEKKMGRLRTGCVFSPPNSSFYL